MTTGECLAFQQAVFEAGDGAALLERRPDLAAHPAMCPGCRRWLEAFASGQAAAAGALGLAAGVMARTAHGACTRARELSAVAIDEPLPAMERALVASHLENCAGCRAVVPEMEGALAALPSLAAIDPGPAFTARVLAATSRRPACSRALDRWRRRWETLVLRPRFAIEAAYALTLCLVLVTGNPLSAVEWTASVVEPLVQRVGAPVQALDARVEAWRSRAAGDLNTATATAAGSRASWVNWVRAVWDGAWRALAERFGLVIATLESLARRVHQWGLDLLERIQSLATEPEPGSVRSPE